MILLTNRVYPTRENNLIREARPAVADAVVRALDPSVGPRATDEADHAAWRREREAALLYPEVPF